ncbi:ead/Ea22-like family protein [Pseudomonas aeruginosa]|uniref:ead/Ea22-like family protein n=1 Tax=Pseudomonas aeruginosa TaxID=287 RepID=UPI003AADF1E8
MTDHAELRRLAEQASSGNWYGEDSQVLIGKHAVAYCNHKVDAQFIGKANPKTVLALLDQIDGLSDELSACTEHPGGCGYWREAAKRRAEERDRLRAQNEALRGALQAVVDDPTWRSNDNTLWPKIIKAMNQPGATSSP